MAQKAAAKEVALNSTDWPSYDLDKVKPTCSRHTGKQKHPSKFPTLRPMNDSLDLVCSTNFVQIFTDQYFITPAPPASSYASSSFYVTNAQELVKFECYINYDGWWRISVQCVAIVDFSIILKPAVNRNLGVNCNAKDIFLFLDGNAPQTQQSARRRGRWTRATQGCICWAVSKVILPSPP